MSVAILVHGGAGRCAPESRPAKRAAAKRAAGAGWAVLESGGSALDAVEAATVVLEDEPQFDSGIGSYLNTDGAVQVDAIVVDGARVDFGAVAAVSRVRNPVRLARQVLEASPHAMLVGEGAERFARELGLSGPSVEMITPEVLAAWRRLRARLRTSEAGSAGRLAGGGGQPADPAEATASLRPVALMAEAPREPVDGAGTTERDDDISGSQAVGDTVGAVARDSHGHVAAATSTGGTMNKWVGRVGDSPIIGSGAWAEDTGGAVSCTGYGEAIMRICLASAVGARLSEGETAPDAAAWAVRHLEARIGEGQRREVGLIVIDGEGRPGWAHNTEGMPYAWHGPAGAGDGV